MALDPSVGEGGALKFAHFEKVRMFGATYRRNASTYAEFSINLNTSSDSPMVPKIRTLALLVFVPWAIKFAKKTRKLHLAVSGRKYF